MSTEDLIEKIAIPLCATFAGAFLAFKYQHSIEKNRDKRTIVQNLMVYRNVGADELEWIKAMNVVDLVFHNNERVRQLLSRFLEYTGDDEHFKAAHHIDVYYDMVYEMCRDCGYTQMTKGDLKNFYAPRALSVHYPNKYPASLDKADDINEPPYPQMFEEITHLGLA